MIRQYKFLTIILAVTLLTACSSDETGMLDGARQATFSARIGNGASRASGTEWTVGDAIGISGVSGSKTYSNVEYSTGVADGNFAPVGDAIYYYDSDPVTFTAYYPYTADGGIISASTVDQSVKSSFDFLWAQASGSNATPDVHFTFAHRMAQINIVFTNGNDVDLSDLTFSIDGLVLDGTFDTATGEAKAAENSTAASLTSTLTTDSKASLIVFPQTADNLTVTANAEGQTYKCVFSLGTLNSGSNYNVSIAVSKNEMTVTDCTIIPWGDGGNVNAEVSPKIAKVGDYYYSDGTYSTEYDAGKNVVGIIFYVGHHPKDGSDYSASGIGQKKCHGYVMAVSVAYRWNVAWLNKQNTFVEIEGISFDTDDWNGYANQKAIERYADNNQNGIAFPDFEAVYKCSIYGTSESEDHKQFHAPAKSSGWFLPSVGQFLGFHAANCETGNLLNNKIEAVKSASNRISNLRYATSWCSTMKANHSAHYVFFPEADSGNVSVGIFELPSTTYVRAMLAF